MSSVHGQAVTPALSTAEEFAQQLERSGPHVFSELEGNYCIFALDRNANRLHAVRDVLGGRTGFFAKSRRGGWCFASWAHQVCDLADIKPAPDDETLARLAAGKLPTVGKSAYSQVSELRPGEHLTVDLHGIKSERFSLSPTEQRRSGSAALVQDFYRRFQRAVQVTLSGSERHRTGCMLSGGLDSGPVAAVAQAELKKAGLELNPISWSLPRHAVSDETDWIRQLSDHLGLNTHYYEPDFLPFDRLDESVVHPDWPIFNPFRPLMDFCYSIAAAAGHGVILNGGAGDELYLTPDLMDLADWRQGNWSALTRRTANRIVSSGPQGALRNPAFRRLARTIARRPPASPQGVTPSMAELVVNSESRSDAYRHFPIPEHAEILLGPRMTFGRAQEAYFASRAGIERRDPYQNEELVQFMLSAPADVSIRNGQSKWIMRECMKGILPEAFRLKERTGLLHDYFDAGYKRNQELIRQIVLDSRTEWKDIFDPELILGALEKGDGRSPTLLRCLGYCLWRQFHA